MGAGVGTSVYSVISGLSVTALSVILGIEAIQNMKKRSKPIIVYNMDYTVYGEFPSITEASESLGCSPKTIHRALQTPKRY